MNAQFGRARCYAALMVGIALMLSGCGGGGGNPASPLPMTPAPSGLSYPNVGTPVVGVAIPALTPAVTGTVSAYSVTPTLPAGLTIDTTSGAISGTPTAATPNTSYVVKATNSGGSTTATLQFAVGSVDVVSESSITRTVVAGTAVYVDVVIQPRYLQFAGTLYSTASDPNDVFAKPVSVSSNNDGTFTLELASSTAAAPAEYSGAATLKLCSDSDCNNAQPVSSVSTNYDVLVMSPTSNWPGDNQTALTAWANAPDWQTFQGNSAHTGFVPVTISPDQLITRWQHGVTANQYFNSLVNLATVTTNKGMYYIAGGNALEARKELDASLVWRYDFSGLAFPSANPPAVSNGIVYIAAGQQSSTYMFAFDAISGSLIFRSQMSSQWENYLAPTVGSDGVYTNAGTYGGMYGFAPSGQQLFFTPLDQQSAWTPAADEDSVYAYSGSRLSLVDPVTGLVKGSIVDPTFTNYIYVVGGSVVLGAANSAFAAAYDNSWLNGGGIGNSLIHFNTQALAVDWQSAGDYPANPAYNSGVLYAANNNPLRLEARSETDGSLLWSWVPPASGDVGFKSEVLLTKNLAFVSTNLSTYAIDLATHKPVWSYPVTGNLALSSNGVLYLEGINTLTAVNAK
jgi:Putative Ig domain/PQQ-like domain